MHFTTLQNTPSAHLTEAFNTAFADYFLPFNLSEEELLAKMQVDKNSRELSVGAFDGERLVAFMLHGFDSVQGVRTVYNGGTGVIPEYRGQGLTRQMYRYALPLLKHHEIDRAVLEVIAQNEPAIKSYERSGFQAVRNVVCFKGTLAPKQANQDVAIHTLETYDWELLDTFGDTAPTWQNSNNILAAQQATVVSLGAYAAERLVGYLIFNPTTGRVHQIATHPEFRRQGIASRLLETLAARHGTAASIINVDERATHLTGFLTASGLEPFIEQVEMMWDLR